MSARAPLFFAWLLAALALLAPAAGAQDLTGKLDTDKPIEIVADSLEVLQEDQVAVFRGNVDAIQGEIRLRANELKVFYKSRKEGGDANIAGSISRIDATGNVFLSSPSETAQGDKGIYYVDRREIALSGQVVLTRGQNVIRGQRLVMNMATGRSRIDGGDAGTASASGGRVRSVFVPGGRGADEGAEAPAAPASTSASASPSAAEPQSSLVPVPASKPTRNLTN